MRCTKCGTDNRESRKFCARCGAALAPECPKCGAVNQPGEDFCGECGVPLAPDRASAIGTRTNRLSVLVADVGASENLEGERKTVTALFADIKGSMELMEDLDPEEARAIIDPALKLMIDAVRRYDGYIVQSTGDGIFALFGAPIAREDHPQRALYAALRMQDELRHYSAKLVADGGNPVEARIGANTGEVVVRTIKTGEAQTEYTPIGHTTNLAARMQMVAPTGSIAISEPMRKLVEGYFALKPLGPTKVKGVAEPVKVYEVTGLGPIRTRLQRAAGRGYTKFVGRQRELDAMTHAAEQAKAAHGQIVAAIGEPGVGKSRLFFEFKAISQSGWLVLEAPSFPHGRATAYLPLIELLHDYFKIAPDDEPRTRREKVAGKVTLLDRSVEEALPYLFALLGVNEGADPFAQMDTQARRRRTQEPIMRLLLRESRNQPLMLVFEDLHWIDEETQALLNRLAEGIAAAPILMLVNYRPEYSHPWAGESNYTQLRLEPLGRESAEEMLSALVGDPPELAPLKRLIIEKTEGNPLFMEEVVQALFDEGALVRNGAVKVTRSLSQFKIPPTVQSILAARIDCLPPQAKELLQTLAVIGTEFPLSLVREVVSLPPEQLEGMLNDLQSGEFIFEQPAATDLEYIFKHTLTHDVAYNSLLSERRKMLHEHTGQAIEALYHERLEDHYPDLARHYRLSRNAAKAVEYLRLTGEQAVGRGAYAQALANVEPALELLKAFPEGPERLRAELGVRLMEGITVTALYGMASTERLHTFERVCQLSEPLGDSAALFLGLLNMGFAHTHRFEALRALGIARRCVELAEQDLNSELLPAAYTLLAQALYRSGDFLQTASVCAGALQGLASAHQRAAKLVAANLWAVNPVNLALVEQALGRPDEALRLSDEALRRARELKQPFSLAWVLGTAAILRCDRREPEAARDLAEAVLTLAEEHGFRELLAWGRMLRAWTMSELGQTAQGLTEFEALAPSVPSVSHISKSMLLAQFHLHVGQAEEAIVIVGQELAGIKKSGAYQEAAELHRLKGEAILARDTTATVQAEECFREAIEIAHGQSAKSWELRATISLARLLANQGKRDDARTTLAEIYNWFTEGFDTADLKDAKTLLDELGT